MKNYVIESVEDLKFIRLNEVPLSEDSFKEVCIDFSLPKEIEKEYELSDYDISVRFWNEGEIEVFVYDNVEDSTREFQFTPKVRDEIIDFAKKYLEDKVKIDEVKN